MQTVTLIEVIAAARARQASLVPESAGYFMLALGRAMAGLPLRADPALVLLSTEGVVTFAGPRTKLPAQRAAEEMRVLLAHLLEVSKGLPGALEAAFDPPDPGAHPLSAFFAAVTRALIPINREAAKRALARLARETLRAIEVGGVVAAPLAPAAEPQPPEPLEPEEEEDDEEFEDDAEFEEFDIDVETPSPVVAAIELLTPTPAGRDATPSPVVAALETLELTPPTPTVVDVVVNGPDATPSAWQDTKPYTFEVRDHQVALGPVSPSSIHFEPDEVDIDDAIDAVRRMSPVDAMPVVAPVVITPTPVPEHAPPSEPPPAEPPTDLEVLTRLQHAAQERALARRKAHARAARKRSKVRASVVAEKAAPELDRLLAHFSGEHDGDAVAEAARGLQRMVALELTPPPTDVTPSSSTSRDSESGPVALSPNAPCRTPADTLGDVEEERTIPPALVSRQGRSMKRPLMFSAGLLVAGVCSAGIVQLRRHQIDATTPTETAVGAAKEHCLADIELTGLPTPHEILLRLGEAPLRTRALPTGVRLELIALAPEHRALRLVVPADAEWQDIMNTRVLRLDAKLERGGLQPWPAAPAGEVGGVGASGVIDVESDPKSAELWLVVGAGDTSSTRVTLDCESEARLLVIATSDPITQRRLHVPVELLRAAAETGAAQVSVGM